MGSVGKWTLAYEDEALESPYTLRNWTTYLFEAQKRLLLVEVKKERDDYVKWITTLFERSVRRLPGSYKLWKMYLDFVLLEMKRNEKTSLKKRIQLLFTRCLASLHTMPVLWVMYIHHVVLPNTERITANRRVFDAALQALPITQHEKHIWPLYIAWTEREEVPTITGMRVYRRYVQLEPAKKEDYVEYLKKREAWDECCRVIREMLDDDKAATMRSKRSLFEELNEIVTRHSAKITSVPVVKILEAGLAMGGSESQGERYTGLADYYIRKAKFEQARDVFEMAVTAVKTVKDFSIVFDAYAQFEESLITATLKNSSAEAEPGNDSSGGAADGDSRDDDDSDNDPDGDSFLVSPFMDVPVSMRMARLERLVSERARLLSDVAIRQNPHDVNEWLRRVAIFSSDPRAQILAFSTAVKTVDPIRSRAKVSTLWIAFAKFYEVHGDVENARRVFEKAVHSRYRSSDDLASVWCEWCEMELRHGEHARARQTAARAVATPLSGSDPKGTSGNAQGGLRKCLNVWLLHADLEESLGTLDDARRAYDAMLDLKIATPQVILNYAHLLRENHFFEESFSVYERGVGVFKYPHCVPIWTTYLSQFIDRFGAKKLERARELFEACLKAFTQPGEDVLKVYMRYATLEEDFGLERRAMQVYGRAASAVPVALKPTVFSTWAARSMHFYGAAPTREIYAAAIDAGMSKSDTLQFSIKFAELERGLGEVDRARAIYAHASQFANPKTEPRFWKEWNDFEVSLGNEDTFRDMLRVRRAAAEAADVSYYAGLSGTIEKARFDAVKRGGSMSGFGGGGKSGGGRRTAGDRGVKGDDNTNEGDEDGKTDPAARAGTKRPAETEMDILERLARAADAEKVGGERGGGGASLETLGFVRGGTIGDAPSDTQAAVTDTAKQDGNEIDIE